jgi:hypothetical protein
MISLLGFDILENFLTSHGLDLLAPHTGRTYRDHLRATYLLLKANGYDEQVCLAGFFHSIYGTEEHEDNVLSPDKREDLKQLIGLRAEKIAWLNCTTSRSSIYQSISDIGPCRDRHNDEISQEDFRDLCIVHYYEWIEQSARIAKCRGTTSLRDFARGLEARGFIENG